VFWTIRPVTVGASAPPKFCTAPIEAVQSRAARSRERGGWIVPSG
jgi:hypothetical protein